MAGGKIKKDRDETQYSDWLTDWLIRNSKLKYQIVYLHSKYFTRPFWGSSESIEFCLCCVVLWLLCCVVLGVRGYFCFEKRPRNLRYTNRRNKGLISVDRRTSLLSYLQYPVPYQSRLQRIYRSQCPKGDWIWCWAEAYRYAWTQRAVDIVAFQHRFWLRGVQSLSCRW